jgi:hypothetical protein
MTDEVGLLSFAESAFAGTEGDGWSSRALVTARSAGPGAATL